jgi:peroxiredoxin
MFKRIAFLGIIAVWAWMGLSTAQAAKVGTAAPDFNAADSHGKLHKLADMKGKFVVLEWHNQDCPFVKSQYKGKMQKLQKTWTDRGVLWFEVVSSAPKTEGYVDATGANEDITRSMSNATAVILDPKGVLGHAYGAKTTPHMFIIDPKGKLIYDGAIDNDPLDDIEMPKTEKGEMYVNYVERALQEAMLDGKPVSIPTTAPYGCHVKYK